MDIYLIRHGESIMNTGENTRIGAIDNKVWLTEKGKEQAKRSAEFLKEYLEYDCNGTAKTGIWVSPYNRTQVYFRLPGYGCCM